MGVTEQSKKKKKQSDHLTKKKKKQSDHLNKKIQNNGNIFMIVLVNMKHFIGLL